MKGKPSSRIPNIKSLRLFRLMVRRPYCLLKPWTGRPRVSRTRLNADIYICIRNSAEYYPRIHCDFCWGCTRGCLVCGVFNINQTRTER